MDETNEPTVIAEEEKIGADATHQDISTTEEVLQPVVEAVKELEESVKEYQKEGKKEKVFNTSATLNPVTGKYEGYVPKKGETPPWDPWNPEKRKNRVTMKERKFMAFLSTTASMQEAYRATYKVKEYGNPALERARVSALANQVLRRIRAKAPELVEAMTFENIDKEFVQKGMLKLYNKEDIADHDKIRLLELMGKTQAMFTDKIQNETKVTEVIKTVYKESDADFPEQDHRLGRLDLENIVGRG